MSQTKTNLGNYFEDFSGGQVLQHNLVCVLEAR